MMMRNIIFGIFLILAVDTVRANVRFGTPSDFWPVSQGNRDYLNYVRYITVPEELQKNDVPAWVDGNDIEGKSPERVNEIVKATRAMESLVQREMFKAMDQAVERFLFRDIAHAKAVVKQRLATIDMMKDFNVGHGQYRYGGAGRHEYGTTASVYWQKMETPFFYRQISGTPYQAIMALCNPDARTYGECKGAIIACVWYGAAVSMGAEKFNLLYADGLNMNNGSVLKNALHYDLVLDQGTYVPGDWGAFENSNYGDVIKIEAYQRKGFIDKSSYTYPWTGENALYLGETGNVKKFGGLGTEEWDIDEKTMRNILVAHYNADLAPVIEDLSNTDGKIIAVINGVIKVLYVTRIKDDTEAKRRVKFTYVKRLIQ